MKVGDIVHLMIDDAIDPNWFGIIVSDRLENGWYEVLRCDAEVIIWPPDQMRKINEKD